MIMKRFLNILPVLAAALVFYAMAPSMPTMELYAQNNSNTDDPDTEIGNTSTMHQQIANSAQLNEPIAKVGALPQRCRSYPEAQDGVLLGVLVPCIAHTIADSSDILAGKFIKWLNPTFGAFLTLVIMFLGVKALTGDKQVHTHAVVFVIKVSMVIGLLHLIPSERNILGQIDGRTGLIMNLYGMMNDGVGMSTRALGSSSGASFHCDIDHYGGENTLLIWKQMDCVLGKLYGFATGQTLEGQFIENPGVAGVKPVNMMLMSSLIGILSGLLFGGTIAVAVFFGLVGMLWSIASLIIRIVMAYLNGFIVVCVMLIISPIFMPLVLLKATEGYFDKWWRAILSAMLLPIIVAAYTVFAFMAYDKLLFAPDSKLQALFNSDFVKRAEQLPRKACSMNVTNDPNFKTTGVQTSLNDMIKGNPFMQDFSQMQLSGSSDLCAFFHMQVIDFSKIEDGTQDFKDTRKALMNIFMDVLKLAIMAYLIGVGLDMVQSSTNNFVGSSIAFAAMSIRSQTEQRVMNAFGNAKKAVSSRFTEDTKVKGQDGVERETAESRTGVRGAKFIQRLPMAAMDGANKLFKGLSGADDKNE